MSRTHHAANAYRLSCGCITEFSSVHQVGNLSERYSVLCAQCQQPSKILVRYPDGCCGATCRATGTDGGVIRVWCSLGKRHDESEHYDETVKVHFHLPARLRSSRQGNV